MPTIMNVAYCNFFTYIYFIQYKFINFFLPIRNYLEICEFFYSFK